MGYIQSLPPCVDIALFWSDDGTCDERDAKYWSQGTMLAKEMVEANGEGRPGVKAENVKNSSQVS